MNTARIRSYNIHLKFRPDSFAKVQAVRNSSAKRLSVILPNGHTKIPRPFPYLSIFGDLPTPLLDSYKQALSKIASQKSPLVIKTFAPQLLQRSTKYGHPDKRDIVFKLESSPIEALRSQIYGELKGDFAALAQRENGDQWEFSNDKDLTIGGYSSLSLRAADRILEDMLQDYPDGAGDLVVEALCLKEYLVGPSKSYSTDGWVSEYPLEG